MDSDIRSSEEFDGHRQGFFRGFKGSAIAGIVVLTPFIALFMVLKWFFSIFAGIPGNEIFYVTSYPLLNQFLKAGALTGLGGLLVIGVGKLTSTKQGLKFEEIMDMVFTNLPVVGSVYSITKTATDTVLRKTEDFQHPVKLSFNGLKLTAFQTGKCPEKDKRMVFVPTSPNITSGFVIEVDESCIEETDDSLQTAFTRVLSAGFSN